MLSFWKILLTIAVIAGVWYGFKYLGRATGVSATNKKRVDEDGKQKPAATEDLVACPSCGTFIPKGSRCTCQS